MNQQRMHFLKAIILPEPCTGFVEIADDRLSPDGRFIAFTEASEFEYTWLTEFGVADCQQEQTVVFSGKQILEPTRMLWSENSSAFVMVGRIIDYPDGIHYVGNYTSHIADAQFFKINTIIEVDGSGYVITQVHDITADGQRVLVSAATDTQQPPQLYILGLSLEKRLDAIVEG